MYKYSYPSVLNAWEFFVNVNPVEVISKWPLNETSPEFVFVDNDFFCFHPPPLFKKLICNDIIVGKKALEIEIKNTISQTGGGDYYKKIIETNDSLMKNIQAAYKTTKEKKKTLEEFKNIRKNNMEEKSTSLTYPQKMIL